MVEIEAESKKVDKRERKRLNNLLSKRTKKAITSWIFKLQEYRHIEVEKFKDLFSQLDEIVFPIKVNESYGTFGVNLDFTDAEGNKYYMRANNFYDLQTYIIGRRNSSLEPLVDREFHYQIYEDKTIMLIETTILQLNNEGKNKDIVAEFCYNYDDNITEATLLTCESKNKIIIKYPTVSFDFDKMVLKFLFDNESKWYYYDVFPILKWIVTAISDENVSISVVAEIDAEIVSEVEVVEGTVQKYTITQIVNEGEMCIIKKLFARDLNKFLLEKS